MALPNFTPEERAKALEKAAQVRKARKELKENIKSGKTDPASVLKTRKDDPLVSKMKVKEFLQAIPGIGGAKADKIMHVSSGSSPRSIIRDFSVRFRRYGNPSSSSSSFGLAQMAHQFRRTVIQAGVHLKSDRSNVKKVSEIP